MPLDNTPTLLQQFVADHDVPCPACNYNLRGLNSSSCPECAQPLVLRVALAEPKLRVVIAATSGLLACAGTGLLGLLLVVGLCIRWSIPPRTMWFAVFGIPVIMAGVGGALAHNLLRHRGRRWLLGISTKRRAVLTILGWLFPIAMVVLFVVTIRE